MENENTNSVTSQEGTSTETEFDPVQAINELKKNTVSKEEYNKVKAEKDKYLRALIEGSQVADEKKEPVDIDALRKSLFTEDLDTKCCTCNLDSNHLSYFSDKKCKRFSS